MAEKKTNAEPGDVVELADKDGGFTDPVTGFDISRDQKLPLGNTIGERTNQAIMTGGLIIVTDSKAKAQAKADQEAEEKATKAANDKAAGNEPKKK